jgi:acetyltransferase-like isoleucine patch superfamily enzyme
MTIKISILHKIAFRLSPTRISSNLYWWFSERVPFLRPLYETRYTQTPISFQMWFIQKVMGVNRVAYWPMHYTSRVGGVQNVYAGIDTSPGWSPGCYIQAIGKVYIGDYTQIGPNVGIISSNHDLYDSRKHMVEHVSIGKYCWIGMGAVILPGVDLGDFTIVGAGSIVTKSFPGGYCIICGNPARLIRNLEKDKCVAFKNEYEYNGYVRADRFEAYRNTHLRV